MHWARLRLKRLPYMWLLLALLPVSAATVAIVAFTVSALDAQIQRDADLRLLDGAGFFHAQITDRHDDVSAAARLLSQDGNVAYALSQRDFAAVDQRLATAVRLSNVDELAVADTAGAIVALSRIGATTTATGSLAGEPGFAEALAGGTLDVVDTGADDLLRQEIYVPLPVRGTGQVAGVLRVAALFDQTDVDRFRAETGLDASLFFGERRAVTTLRHPGGAFLTDVRADTGVLADVEGRGVSVTRWRDLPIGRFRTHYVPLDTPDGTHVGMVAIAEPVSTLSTELKNALMPMAVAGPLVLLIGTALAVLLMRRVRHPVVQLAAAATRLGAGDLTTPIASVKPAELEALAAELERVRVRMQAHMQAMSEAEARQRAIIAALPCPVLVAAADGCVTEHNDAASALFGGRQLDGNQLDLLLPFVDVTGGRQQEGFWSGTIDDAAGLAIDLEVRRTSLIGARPAGADVYVIADVSHMAELQRLRERLLYDVAHELRSPLAVLDNTLEILSSEYGDLSAEEFDRLLASTRRIATRLRGLMEDLLSAGSIQAGRFVVRPRPSALGAIVDDAMALVEPALAARGQQVDKRLNGLNDLCVLADPPYLRQVLVNLLTNASKYGPDQQPIEITAERIDGRARVAVMDHGAGIPAEQRAGLFDRFYRVRPKNEEPGIGLGLAITKGIVQAHGGVIAVESEAGKGTVVWFTVPTVDVQ